MERPDTNEAPIEITKTPQSLDEHAMAFPRDEAGDAEQGPRRAMPPSSVRCRLCRARRDDGYPVWRDTVLLDRHGGSPAGADDPAKPRQDPSLQSRKPLRLGPRKAGLRGQCMVHEGNEPQTGRLRREGVFETRESKAVDDGDGLVGKGGKDGPIGFRREFEQLHRTPAGAQSLDNVAIVEISAGQLIEPARDGEDEVSTKRSVA
jgi:hypothetical protein